MSGDLRFGQCVAVGRWDPLTSGPPQWADVMLDGVKVRTTLLDGVSPLNCDTVTVVQDGRRLVTVTAWTTPPPMAHTATLRELFRVSPTGASPWRIGLTGATAGRSAVLWVWGNAQAGVTVTDDSGNTWTRVSLSTVSYAHAFVATFTAGVPTEVSVTGLPPSDGSLAACEEFLPIGTAGAWGYGQGGQTVTLTPGPRIGCSGWPSGLAVATTGINTTVVPTLTGGTWTTVTYPWSAWRTSYAFQVLPQGTLTGATPYSSPYGNLPAYGIEMRLLNLP